MSMFWVYSVLPPAHHGLVVLANAPHQQPAPAIAGRGRPRLQAQQQVAHDQHAQHLAAAAKRGAVVQA